MRKYEFVIIGGGAAGFAAAMKAEELGVRTLMVNDGQLGGTCVNVGCVPTKYLLAALELRRRALNHHYPGLILKEEKFDFKELMEGKKRLVERLRRERYEDVLMGMENVDYVSGFAKFRSNHEIVVSGEIFEFEKALIATGSKTRILPVGGVNEVRDRILTNVEALSLNELPRSIVIIGGRTQALEFAQIFARSGSEVVLLQRSPRIMPIAEPELSIELQRILMEEGVDINTSVRLERLERRPDGIRVHAEVRGEKKAFEGEYVLFATGRKPNTQGLGLENTDVRTDGRGFVVVDRTLRAGKNLYAAGDVTGEPMLETVAAKEGHIAAVNALEGRNLEMDYRVVPRVVFTDPQLASVGLTDEEARMRVRCSCRVVRVSQVPKALILGEDRGLAKMVINAETGEILGVHLLAYDAAEVMHEAAMVIKNRMTVDDVIDSLHVFPTLSEVIKLVALSFNMDVSKMPCCVV